MWQTVHSQIIHFLRTPSLQLPGPPAVARALPPPLPSNSLKLSSSVHPSISFPSCISVSFYPFLAPLISISSLSLPSLHPAAVTKALFLSVRWRLVWSRTHARCSALRDRLTAHRGERDRAGARKKMREGGILNGEERIKERRKVGGGMVGQIRLTERGRRR